MAKHCGTCGRWQQGGQEKRPASIRTINNGICRLNHKERRADEMKGCFGWAQADQDEIERRGFGEKGEESEICG